MSAKMRGEAIIMRGAIRAQIVRPPPYRLRISVIGLRKLGCNKTQTKNISSFHSIIYLDLTTLPWWYENQNIQERSQASLGLVSEVIDGLNMRGAQLEPYPSPCSDVSVTFKPGIQTRLLPNSWQFNFISSSSSPLKPSLMLRTVSTNSDEDLTF